MSVESIQRIVTHYEDVWGGHGNKAQWQTGPTWQLPPGFHVLVIAPSQNRNRWIYATCGMSQQGDAPALELHLFSPFEHAGLVELLTIVAHFHVTGAYLDLGHTVNFGLPWLERSRCDHGLISLPYLEGPKLEWLDMSGRRVRCLWLIPITLEEKRYKVAHGVEALEQQFESANFNYLDPLRNSVV